MGIVELFFIAVSLAMDAFAVSLCQGLSMKGFSLRRASLTAFSFGFFQALMPLIGWLLGTQFEQYITEFDHWIAFVLLGFIGAKMIYEALTKDESCPRLDLKNLLMLSVATSIDALAVGITFAFLRVDIVPAVLFIGIVTFIICFAGVALGSRFGSAFKGKAELLGGAVLILIGTKILLEHLGILQF